MTAIGGFSMTAIGGFSMTAIGGFSMTAIGGFSMTAIGGFSINLIFVYHHFQHSKVIEAQYLYYLFDNKVALSSNILNNDKDLI